jgi:predicted ester cyclase
MGNKEAVKTFLDALQAADADTLASCCADGFSFSGPVPEPLGAQEFAGVAVLMKSGIPDMQYNSKIQREEGDVVHITSHLTGTHTGDLDLAPMGMGLIPATGKSFALPAQTGQITVKGGKVAKYHVDSSPDGGLAGILKQLGVAMP